MTNEERLKKLIEQFHKQMERFTQSEKYQQSEELKKWYEKSLNEAIDGFLDSENMYEELRKVGYPDRFDYPNTTAYINALKPLSQDFMAIVLHSIPKRKYKEAAIQYLREAKNKYDGRILIPIFNDADKQGKWFLCDAIVHNPPLHISDWVKEIYLDKQYDYSETGLLPLAVVKLYPRDEARDILKRGFDHHYRVTPEALGKVGKLDDIPFLEEKLLVNYDAIHVKKDIDKAIKKIKNREA